MDQTTGIVRHIDDLGRIAIPKEIRKACRIREGDPMEITILRTSGDLILKKYNPAPSLFKEGVALREAINSAAADFVYFNINNSALLTEAEQLVAEACRKLSEFEKLTKGE